MRLIRGELWHHITQDDEDAAYWRLKRYFKGRMETRALEATPAEDSPGLG